MTCRDREDHELEARFAVAVEAINLKLDWIAEQLVHINRQEHKIMGAQEDINAAVAALQNDETGLDASVQAIQAEIANLQGQGVDVSALNAEVANLQSHVDAVAALAPAPPAP